MCVASFAAGAVPGRLRENSFFAGIAAEDDQAQEWLQVLHRCKFCRKFCGEIGFCKFCRGFAAILTTPAAELAKPHCCIVSRIYYGSISCHSYFTGKRRVLGVSCKIRAEKIGSREVVEKNALKQNLGFILPWYTQDRGYNSAQKSLYMCGIRASLGFES